ncbi:MAG TPA: DUF922 domain-containing protein [Gemmatimonadales bacterium]|nr:DUF922 domain-containing protein [Gemmatimonadales bacterium]
MKLGVALLVAAALGCASAPTRARSPAAVSGGSSALDDLMRNDLADDHAIAWTAGRRLTWKDFQGDPPTEGSEGAKTAYTLYSAWKCRGSVFEFRVIAGFQPRQSWVKAVVLDDTTQRRTVLSHEQTHFDLAEVHARIMRRTFGDLARPCSQTDAQLSALAQRLAQDEKAEQRRYDAETNHGLRASQQAAWSTAVTRRLR